MTRLLLLSHPLTGDAPVWPDNPPAAEIKLRHSIARGDDANTTALKLFSHSGTHVDTPWHFNPDGPAAWQLPVEAFVFEVPRLIRVPAGQRTTIGVEALAPHAATIAEADFLMLLTGWSAQRATDPARYAREGPLLRPEAARWLLEAGPRLRGIATDAISIAAPWDTRRAVETHHELMGVRRNDGRFVLIYEDVRLVPEAAAATRVLAWPLFIEGADGSPVTIVAELPDEG
jgi:arylformamidase